METPERIQHSLAGHAILLVEDNEDDVFIMRRAFRKANIPNVLQSVNNGEEALEYLEGTGVFSDRKQYPFPGVVFLDLNMPRKTGFEVLEYIRRHEILRKLTVNVLSSSTRPSDIDRAAFLGANTYLIKPAQIEKFQELIQSWFNRARFEAFPVVQ